MSFVVRRLLATFRRLTSGPSPDPYARALAALDRGDPAEAVAALTAILHAAGDDGRRVLAYNKRGVAHVRLGRREEALRDFTEALALDGRFAPAIANVGNLLFEDGAVEEAIVHYEAAIRADEAYPVAHFNLAAAYRRLGRRSEAVRELRLANRLEGKQLFRRGLGGERRSIQ